MATKRSLATKLGVVAGFERPDAALEQYPTPPELAAHVVHLADLHGDVDGRTVIDLGTGTGMLALAAALRGPARVVGLELHGDALATAEANERRVAASAPVHWVRGDATRPPFVSNAFDLVACQALLVNLPEPAAALDAFVGLSSDRVAAVEPDNADVSVDSTVDSEVDLERRVRTAYIRGVRTDVAIGDRLERLFREAGLDSVRTRRHYHRKIVEPPYDRASLSAAARKASGAGLADHEAELRRALTTAEYDELRAAWREMGRSVVDAMREGTYRRVEVVPFDVVVGRVAAGG